MEIIKTCELCRELIIKTEDFENLNCDEKQNLQILQNLEITVSKDAKICSNCVNVSHLTYNFKTSCLTNNDHLKTLVHPGINDKLILEEVIVEKSKSEFKNEKVCRFCLNFSEVNSLMEVNLEQDVVLKDMLERCLPKIDMKFVQNPLMCYICNKLLKKLYNFISQCEDTEVFRNLDPRTDVLVNENTSTLTVENNDENINESFVKEENCDGIENPELEIKSEDFDINKDIKDSIKESNCLLKNNEVQKSYGNCEEERVQLYKCNICTFTASNQREIVKHKKKGHKHKKQGLRNPVAEKDVTPKPRGTIKEKKFVCEFCSYQTISKSNAKRHYRVHKKPSEVNLFKCDHCSFATKWKNSLKKHAICHQDPSNLPKFKCNDCPYETHIRENLVCHVQVRHLRHHKEGKQPAESNQDLKKVGEHNSVEEKDVKPKPRGTIKEKKFVCDICSHQATKPSRLKQHYLVHKEPSEVNLFKCDYCPFATKWKNCLKKHAICHDDASELPRFKCNDCPYETCHKDYLVRHVLVHKTPSQIKMYKCKVCPYQAKYLSNIKKHEERHQVGTQLHISYTCDECNYTSKFIKRFTRHLRHHNEGKQPAKRTPNLERVGQHNLVEEKDVTPKPRDTIKEKIFVCDICSHQSNRIGDLKQHYLIHKEPSEVNMFKCDYCRFTTKWKGNLSIHTIRHKNPSELTKFKCNDCPYETNFRSYLVRHVLTHKSPSQVNMYKCKVCPYQTKRRINLQIHQEKHQKQVPEIYTCDECNYKSKFKQCVWRHVRYHEKSKQPANSSQDLK